MRVIDFCCVCEGSLRQWHDTLEAIETDDILSGKEE